jgi:hypothetical protein
MCGVVPHIAVSPLTGGLFHPLAPLQAQTRIRSRSLLTPLPMNRATALPALAPAIISKTAKTYGAAHCKMQSIKSHKNLKKRSRSTKA